MWLHSDAATSGRTNTPSGDASRSPPEPTLPPTDTLNPLISSPSTILIAGVSARSCVSACVQLAVQAVIATLNFLGRLVNALFFKNALVNSCTTGDASNNSSAPTPATAQPTT